MRRARWIAGGALALALALPLPSGAAAARSLPAPPPPGDLSAPSLQRYQEALLAAWGGDHRTVPLEVKARHFEWMLWRYHRTPWKQILPRVDLGDAPGDPVTFLPGADVSTWNGALLSALSHRYAATRDPATLERIAWLLEGLHRFQEVTGVRGLAARCVLASETPLRKLTRTWIGPDGTRYHWRPDPAKGTYNQLVMGYAALAVHAYADLPPEARRRARLDLEALTSHVVRGGFRIRDAAGNPTRYGNLRPRVLGLAIPFNAQVAWLMVAAGRHLPTEDPAARAQVEEAHARLDADHPYWRSPRRHWLVRPQRVGDSVFIDGNDRNHLMGAAFTALALELDAAAREGRPADRARVHRLGRTLYWTARRLPEHRYSLANFMWAATIRDPERLAAIVPDPGDRARVRREAAVLLDQGVEQLRRFPLDRFIWEGTEGRSGGPYWMDEYRPDSYAWKIEPDRHWIVTGPPTHHMRAAIDFLHAYWLMRHTGLDRTPSIAAKHGRVLARSRQPF